MALRKGLAFLGPLLVPPGGDHPVDDRIEDAERVEHAQPVLPDVDPGTEDAQLAVLLVDAHAPALAGKGEPGGEAGDAAAGDLDAAGHGVKLTGLSRRQTV